MSFLQHHFFAIINFILFAIMLVILMRRPVRVFLSTRREQFRLRMESSRDRRHAAEKRLSENEARLRRLDGEVAALLKEMEVQGIRERDTIVGRTRERAKIMHLDAQRQVTHDLVKLRQDMYRRAVASAIQGAQQTIGERLVGKGAARMVDASIDMIARRFAVRGGAEGVARDS